jgi:TatD DNase family protein
MIDSHCHLTDGILVSQLDVVLSRAAAVGVSRAITIGTDLANSRGCIDICRGRAQLRCAVGVHPHEAAEAPADIAEQLRRLLSEPAVVAVGEIGLDYHYDFSPRDRQAAVFEAQLAVAAEGGWPVVIHCREAVDDCLAIMTRFAPVRAVFHCFTGTDGEARRVLDAGCLLGFTGVVTFPKSELLRDVVRMTPLDRLLVETDAPYLSPEPFRRQRVNEPALVVHVAAEVARVKGVTVERIDQVTTANAMRLFRW